jgi:hypothetical protein
VLHQREAATTGFTALAEIKVMSTLSTMTEVFLAAVDEL